MELFEVTLLFGVTPSDSRLYCDSYSLHLHVFIYTSVPNLDLSSAQQLDAAPFRKDYTKYFDAAHSKKD